LGNIKIEFSGIKQYSAVIPAWTAGIQLPWMATS